MRKETIVKYVEERIKELYFDLWRNDYKGDAKDKRVDDLYHFFVIKRELTK